MSERRAKATPPCSTSACKHERRARSRDAVGIELQRFEPSAEQNDMAGAASDAIVGKLEGKRSAQAKQPFRVACKAGARAVDGIVEKLQSLRPARFPRRERSGLARPQRIEQYPAPERDDNQYEDFGHANPLFADMGVGVGIASRQPLRPTDGLRVGERRL